MARLTRKALLSHLNKSDKEEIVGEVITLFDKFKNVREFYAAELMDEKNPLLERYKNKIAEAYSKPNPKERTTNINLNRLITEFKKISVYNREVIDLMLYRVECGVNAFVLKNRRTSTFYKCILATFEEAVKIMVADGSTNEFRVRVKKILKDAEPGKYEIAERMRDIAIEL